MALVFYTASQVAQQYLDYLKGEKPEVNTNQTDSDWWVRGQVVGGVVAGVYSDQRLIADDAFPQNARREALQKHLFTYFGDSNFRAATPSDGNFGVTGTVGSVISAGMQAIYSPNGNIYTANVTVTLSAAIGGGQASGLVAATSVGVGQSQNLLGGAALNLPSPPAGVNAAAVVDANGFRDGTNEETEDEAAARILARIRQRIRGGTISDYQQWAFEADISVTSANVLRYPFGFGTVAVIITAGTTDIDTAINDGDPIITTPSDALVAAVQAYIDGVRPVTDCASVVGAVPLSVDVTVSVRFTSGNAATVLAGQTLSQGALVAREVQRAIYKTPAGGRQFGASGFVVCSELEDTIDTNLSAGAVFPGALFQIVSDRQVANLSATGPNLLILGSQNAIPGTILVVDM